MTVRNLPTWCCLLAVLLCGCATAPESLDSSGQYSVQQLTDLGENFLAAGDTGQALKYLVAAAGKQPNDPRIHYDLGLAYDARNMPQDALKHFQEALRLKPDYGEAQNALGAFYAVRGNLTEAEKYFRMALNNPYYRTPYYAYFNLGRLCEERNDLGGAMTNYQQAVRIRPNYAPAYARMGSIYDKQGRVKEATEAYRQAVRFNPQSAQAHFDYARACYRMGDKETARNEFMRVIELSPQSKLAEEARRYLIENDG